ncbi:MAG: SDR family NAD(P)-dependent oxidoreductase, partial [Alphaproteobacteria bacterium]
MGRVEGKVALVTGAASGLGKADAQMLASEGARVVVTDIDPKGAALADALGGDAMFLAQDVADEARWQQVIAAVKARYGRLDILVNNAGIVLMADPEQTTLADFRKVNRVMSEGVFLGCKYA